MYIQQKIIYTNATPVVIMQQVSFGAITMESSYGVDALLLTNNYT